MRGHYLLLDALRPQTMLVAAMRGKIKDLEGQIQPITGGMLFCLKQGYSFRLFLIGRRKSKVMALLAGKQFKAQQDTPNKLTSFNGRLINFNMNHDNIEGTRTPWYRAIEEIKLFFRILSFKVSRGAKASIVSASLL